MRIHSKQATAALNLMAVAVVVCLYCLDKMAADPVAAIPDRASPPQASDSGAPKVLFERLEARIKMTNMKLPPPPSAVSAMPVPQSPASQSPASKQALSESKPL